MTSKVTFTEASVRRAIAAARKSGLYVVAIKPDGTVVTTDIPVAPPTGGPYEEFVA